MPVPATRIQKCSRMLNSPGSSWSERFRAITARRQAKLAARASMPREVYTCMASSAPRSISSALMVPTVDRHGGGGDPCGGRPPSTAMHRPPIP